MDEEEDYIYHSAFAEIDLHLVTTSMRPPHEREVVGSNHESYQRLITMGPICLLARRSAYYIGEG